MCKCINVPLQLSQNCSHFHSSFPSITRKSMCQKEPDPKKESHKDDGSFPEMHRFIPNCILCSFLFPHIFILLLISFDFEGLLRPITVLHWLISFLILTNK